jgi:hypothetical protein
VREAALGFIVAWNAKDRAIPFNGDEAGVQVSFRFEWQAGAVRQRDT